MVHSRKHFLLVAFPAYGHLIPLLELGKKIVKQHHVTLAVSACMLPSIAKRKLIPNNDFPVIGIPDGHVEVEFDETNLGNRSAFDAMYAAVTSGARKLFLEVPAADNRTPSHGITIPVDTVIGDNMLADPLTVCHTRGIPYHFFNTASIAMTLGALLVDDDTPTLPECEENNMGFVEAPVPGATEVPPLSPVMKALMLPINKSMHLAAGIVVNSVRDIENDLVEIIRQFPIMKEMPIRFVGPLVPVEDSISDVKMEQQSNVQTWLDNRANQSVIYVSFGSIAVPTSEQTKELVKGLLQLNKPFILSLAAGQHKHLPDEVASKMATQFQDGQFLILPWAPQKLILQHPATALFLSHCGWNSTLESVFCGMPVVAWPMFADQKINAEWLVQRDIAVIVEGTGVMPKRIVPAEEIASTLLHVGWKGDSTKTSYRQAAEMWRDRVNGANRTGGSSVTELQDLMDSDM